MCCSSNFAERLAKAQQLAIGGHLVTFEIIFKHAEMGMGILNKAIVLMELITLIE